MRVCSHASTNLKKLLSSKHNKFSLFTNSFIGWNLKIITIEVCHFFSIKLTFYARKICILESIFLQNKNWLYMQDFKYKTLWLKNFSSNQCLNKEFCVFSWENYFIKAIETFFHVFAYPDINTKGVGRILNSYANPRLQLGFAKLSRILPTFHIFISG